MKINKDLNKRFDEWCEINIQYLKENGNINTSALLIDKENKATVIMLLFRNSKEKVMMRTALKLFALSQNIKGYFFVSDTILTSMSKKAEETPKRYDALVQMLCTPKGSIQRTLLHDGKGKEIKVKGISDEVTEQHNVQSEWNVFGEHITISEKELNEYDNFKKQHPELYKEVS